MIKVQNYIDGKFCEAQNGKTLDIVEPATGNIFGTMPDSGSEDVDRAVQAGKRAFKEWKNISGEKRMDYLMKIAEGIERHFEEFAKMESQDTGKPLSLARKVDIPRAIANFRFFAGAAWHFSSESHSMPEAVNFTLRQPLGVVGCISPWNLPIYLLSWKVAPALAAGNCVVAKPSEVTPCTAWLLARVCDEAGLPHGVLNIVHGVGNEAGRSLVEHPDIKAISFTGGTATGKQIAAAAAPMFKKLSLELGGKNPTIVFADCDLDSTVDEVIRASFTNQGEICLCGSRIFIEEKIFEQFKEAFIYKTRQLKVGDPLENDTHIGAIVSAQHQQKILHYIQLGAQEGGRILFGGKKINVIGRCASGYFIEPTVFEGLSPECRTMQEEIFGPVVTLTPFTNEQEAIELANNCSYGLSCSIWTKNLQRAMYMANHIEAGVVWINCWLLRDLRTPFGGVKQSGVGREGGWEAMRFFTETKNVCMKY
ncbi:MAG: aldehyde dehydrogenase [Chitinophagales bacterium]|nr:aldehyde dehydrogenase [Chitinophagales bacterium]MDW8273016.1 aldehyde dehydrogenase [Chitinophagales bacterium]